MDINAMVEQVKSHPDYPGVGMVLCHNGVVRRTSRDGREVSGLRVTVDHEKLASVVARAKDMDGIVDVLVAVESGKVLGVGDDVMAIVVGGDIRENVIAALTWTLNTIKTSVTHKTEYYK